MKNKKKIIIASVIVVLIICITSTIAFALFSSRQEELARINIGNLDVVLEEDWPDDVSEEGIDRNTKKVKGTSVADKKAYVRLRFIPVVEYFFEGEENGQQVAEWRTAPIAQEYIKIKVENNQNWIKQGEYYYYKKILKPRKSTEELSLSWEILEIPSTIARFDKIRTDVRVLLEYSQVSNEVWKDIFQINDLPQGVERVDGESVTGSSVVESEPDGITKSAENIVEDNMNDNNIGNPNYEKPEVIDVTKERSSNKTDLAGEGGGNEDEIKE